MGLTLIDADFFSMATTVFTVAAGALETDILCFSAADTLLAESV